MDFCKNHDTLTENIQTLREDVAVIKNDISTIKDRLDRMDLKLNNTVKKSVSLMSIPIKDIVVYLLLVLVGLKTYGVM